jgi:hypothetical protein
MSLNTEQQARTRDEFQANYHLCGVTAQQIQTDLGFTSRQLDHTLHIHPASDPADVWLLRDYLDKIIRHHGGDPVPFTVLTERYRLAASLWFSLRRVPDLNDHSCGRCAATAEISPLRHDGPGTAQA